MVSPQGTSFIPQRPTHGKAAPRKVRKIYVLAYLTYVLFFGALISSGLVFFLSFSLEVQLQQQQEALAAERDLFNQGDIESIRDLEKRINLARERLDNHVSVLAIFEALEASAVQSLSFVGFTYTRVGDEFPEVAFIGNSAEFNNILFQREIFATNPILAGSNFKEVSLQNRLEGERIVEVSDKAISFTLEKEVDTSLIGYTPRTQEMPSSFDTQESGTVEAESEVDAAPASEETQ